MKRLIQCSPRELLTDKRMHDLVTRSEQIRNAPIQNAFTERGIIGMPPQSHARLSLAALFEPVTSFFKSVPYSPPPAYETICTEKHSIS